MSDKYKQLIEKPIIVIGAPRSGTTLTGKILKHHHALAYSEEPRLIWRYGNDDKSDMLRREDATPKVKNYIRNAFGKLVHENGKQRLLEKTPSNALRLEFIDEVFPDCKFVHIIRDGVESALAIRSFWDNHAQGLSSVPSDRIKQRLKELTPSQIPHYCKEIFRRTMPKGTGFAPNVWGPRIPGIDQLVRDLDILEVSALQWRTCVETACQQGRAMPDGRYMEIRLEQLTPDILKSIITFCELEDSQPVIDFFEGIYDPNRAKHRKAEGDESEVKQIMRWIEPTMKWIGYI